MYELETRKSNAAFSIYTLGINLGYQYISRKRFTMDFGLNPQVILPFGKANNSYLKNKFTPGVYIGIGYTFLKSYDIADE